MSTHRRPRPADRASRPPIGVRDDRPRPPPARSRARASSLAKRSLIKTWRTPEALIDVTLQPIIFLLMFIYIFGGAIAGGSQHAYLQFVLPGDHGADDRDGAASPSASNLNTDIEKGVFDRFRSACPSPARRRWSARCSADVVRYLILVLRHPRLRLPASGFRVAHERARRRGRVRAGRSRFALCFCWISVFVGMMVRTPGAVQGIMFLLVLPLSFGSNTFVPTATMPGWLQAFVNVNPMSTWSARCAG